MKQSSFRDFQRNFFKLYKDKQIIQVIRNGESVGYWLPIEEFELLQKRDGQASTSQNTALEGSQVTGINETVPVTIEQEPNPDKCKVCNKRIYESWYSGKYWNDGEELDLDICPVCYKQHKPKGFKLHGKPLPKRTRR